MLLKKMLIGFSKELKNLENKINMVLKKKIEQVQRT